MKTQRTKSFQYDFTLEQVRNEQRLSFPYIARMMGVTKDAVRQMLEARRDIYLREVDGRWEFLEIKPWKHEPDKGVNRLTGRRAPKPKAGRLRNSSRQRLSRVRRKQRESNYPRKRSEASLQQGG